MSAENTDARNLKWRIAALERLILSVYCLAVSVLIIVGLLTPFLTEHVGEDNETSWSVLNYLFNLPTDADEGPGLLAVAFMIGFIGLTLVSILILFAFLLPAARRTLTERWLMIGRVLVALGVIGAAIVLLFSLSALGTVRTEMGAGSIILLVGMLALVPLLTSAARPYIVDATIRPDYMR
ncbi:hypothetical protein [Microbacterium sp.]|uniref:hypothetical protein n=1 Tax=Microbacterium sp. TaxID=51671 RepID=UPI00260E0D1F|nr:hypothetical protein [Microbacterium sp.]